MQQVEVHLARLGHLSNSILLDKTCMNLRQLNETITAKGMI